MTRKPIHHCHKLLTVSAVAFCLIPTLYAQQKPQAIIRPGQVWLDTMRKPINAHGGCVIFHHGIYYWYGTQVGFVEVATSQSPSGPFNYQHKFLAANSPEGTYKLTEAVKEATEAPAIVKHQGRYWMLGSGSTDWNPNPAYAYSSQEIFGPWQYHGNPCEGTNPDNQLGPEHPYESRYIWLPLAITDNNMSIP